MLAAKYRFHGHASLKFIFGHGKTYRFKYLSVRIADNPRRQVSRAAVVVSKKVIKASPKRNRVRRRIYELLRQDWAKIRPGLDIVISIYDPAILIMLHEELVAEVQKALKQSHALNSADDKEE